MQPCVSHHLVRVAAGASKSYVPPSDLASDASAAKMQVPPGNLAGGASDGGTKVPPGRRHIGERDDSAARTLLRGKAQAPTN
eukprot:1976305-Amphidinium_carterae.1